MEKKNSGRQVGHAHIAGLLVAGVCQDVLGGVPGDAVDGVGEVVDLADLLSGGDSRLMCGIRSRGTREREERRTKTCGVQLGYSSPSSCVVTRRGKVATQLRDGWDTHHVDEEIFACNSNKVAIVGEADRPHVRPAPPDGPRNKRKRQE